MERLEQRQVETLGRTSGSAEQDIEGGMTEAQRRTPHVEVASILDAIPAILIGVDASGIVTLWNPAATRALRLPATEVIGQRLVTCPISWDVSAIAQGIDACLHARTPQRWNDVRYRRPDHREGFLGITFSPYGARDHGHGVPLLATDTTEQRLLASQLAEAQKLESIGQLAAGIAHEINTPIQYVGDNLRFLQEAWDHLSFLLDGGRDALRGLYHGLIDREAALPALQAFEDSEANYLLSEVPSAIADALDGAGRVSEIVRAMREFAHPALATKTAIDVNRTIQSTITVARNEWKRTATVVTDLDPDLPLVPCLPAELNQVILNVLINAVHAIADAARDDDAPKGTITVTTRAIDDWVEIRVSDTGTGIPADIRGRVFDPFFTTKEVGRGTGQGLAIAHAVIVEKHGGTITFETTPGKGTTFIIRLPIACGPVPRETTQ
ncbi:MAG TPA: PAS domain-containing protein [Chloroflexi bacterium]|jgi:signal transduction histidine kinase|nr:PAS domain-containing protein [Chloroflexota bacterium]